ncbi:hypothetical protein [Phytobacter diazotrophicus]|uniref:hypothetical protein n=1 Tax=Phytobacter diazotrophicus TaxID=395631 RepID=UPI0030767E3D
MKQVTMESVKQRINELTSTGIVSLRGDFELACLRELVAVTEQRDALVVDNVVLKEALTAVIDRSSEPEYHYAGMGCGVEDNGLQADGYSACEYGWREAMQRVYSEVIPDAFPETPATDVAIAALRAEALPPNIAEIIDSGELESILFASEASYSQEYRLAFYNFRQLRESKREVQS